MTLLETDVTIPLTVSSSMLIAGGSIVVWWYVRERIREVRGRRDALEKQVRDHIESCNQKAISYAILNSEVTGMKTQLSNVEKKIDTLTEALIK